MGNDMRRTRIHTIFLCSGHQAGYEAYKKHHPDIRILENRDILRKIEDECEGVEFTGSTEPLQGEEALSAVTGTAGNTSMEYSSLDGPMPAIMRQSMR
ncbi:MAG: hypothetical protein JXA57_07550 [Armatimonadetes bacterium]|nr:hypothetical protein [Armatimonadota bacterium]